MTAKPTGSTARVLFTRRASLGLIAGLGLPLAACDSNLPFSGSSANPSAAPVPDVQSQPLPGNAPVGDTLGTGPVKVAAILPLTSNGAPSPIGQALRNAALLAVTESGATDITLMVFDDQSTTTGASLAAQTALASGAELIVGPLFAANVREVGKLAKAAGKPVIAFSTDSTVATHGVYLLSFLVETYVDRIIEFAADKGKKSFGILAPQNDYANIAVNEFQTQAARLNARVVVVGRYPAGQPTSAIPDIQRAAAQIDALFIPEQADGMAAVSAALVSAGVKAQLLGTGVWNDSRVTKLPGLQGAWFSAPENAGFNAFATRYKAKFTSDPPRLATLVYDAVSLVAALSRAQPPQRFSDAQLTNASGFNGADGVFRFRPDGPNDRGLAVMQISAGNASVISPAPKSFVGG